MSKVQLKSSGTAGISPAEPKIFCICGRMGARQRRDLGFRVLYQEPSLIGLRQPEKGPAHLRQGSR